MPSSSTGIIYLLLLCSFFPHCPGTAALCAPQQSLADLFQSTTFLLTQRHHPLKCSHTAVQCVLLFRRSMSCPHMAK